MSSAAPKGTHAPGIANPTAAVAERKAARPSSMEKLTVSAPIASTTAVDGAKVTVSGATMKVALSDAPCAAATASVVFVTEAQFAALDASVKSVLALQEFKAAAKTVAVAPGATPEAFTVYAGLGSVIDGVSTSATAYLTLTTLRNSLFAAVTKAKTLKATAVTVALPAVPVSAADNVPTGFGCGVKPVSPASAEDAAAAVVPVGTPATPASVEDILDAAVRMVVTANWKWDKYWKAESSQAKNPALEIVNISVDTAAAASPFSGVSTAAKASSFAASVAVAESLLLAREFGNERADVLTPAAAEELARSLVASHSDVMKIRVLQVPELLANGFNLITAVGQCAVVPPRIIAIEYDNTAAAEGALKNQEFLALVGKGLCYDTGGLNLKPTGSMETMYMDKCGAAAVFGTMRALATVRPATKVVGILAMAENAIGAKAYKPYAVIDSHAGSVQVGNTDAEGRLCLADALTFVQNEYKPTHVVDIATLTGACMIALGEHCAGLFSNSDPLAQSLAKAGGKHCERLWRLPLFPEHTEEIVGEDADINSTGRSRYAGASTAAAFLQHYIQGGVQWGHVDIAGPATGSAVRGCLPKNATGFGMQTLYQLTLDKAAGKL